MKYWSGSVWVLTISYVVVMLVMIMLGVYFICNSSQSKYLGVTMLLVSGIMIIGLIYVWLCYPRRIWLEKGDVKVERIVRPLTIPVEDIANARCLSDYDRKGIMRVVGNGGIAGYTGEYKSSTIKRFSMSAYNLKDLMLIELRSGKRYVFSYDPDDKSGRSLTNLPGLVGKA